MKQMIPDHVSYCIIIVRASQGRKGTRTIKS